MAQFNVPSETARNSLVVETFRGVDLNNSPSNVDKSRSPAAPNMIRDQVGKVRKRMGYTTKLTAPEGAAINGVHHLLEETLIHAGVMLDNGQVKEVVNDRDRTVSYVRVR